MAELPFPTDEELAVVDQAAAVIAAALELPLDALERCARSCSNEAGRLAALEPVTIATGRLTAPAAMLEIQAHKASARAVTALLIFRRELEDVKAPGRRPADVGP